MCIVLECWLKLHTIFLFYFFCTNHCDMVVHAIYRSHTQSTFFHTINFCCRRRQFEKYHNLKCISKCIAYNCIWCICKIPFFLFLSLSIFASSGGMGKTALENAATHIKIPNGNCMDAFCVCLVIGSMVLSKPKNSRTTTHQTNSNVGGKWKWKKKKFI